MRASILTGTRHGEKLPVVINDSTHSPEENRLAFKALCGQREHPEFGEVQLWHSDAGITARHRMKPAEVEPPKAPHEARRGRASKGTGKEGRQVI